jgi:hypothetical protein
VPVIGKREMPETARLFRLMGKRVVVLADLDALADDTSLVNAFAEDEDARKAAICSGHSDLFSMDRPLRTEFARAVAEQWIELAPLAAAHHYLQSSEGDPPSDMAKRRATLAVVLSADETTLRSLPNGQAWAGLRSRFGALLSVLEAAGCFLLRRGTVEDCYFSTVAPGATGKPEAAADEAAAIAEAVNATLRQHYADALRAIECAAPAPLVDENAFLRGHLAGLLGTVFQMLKANTDQEDINFAARSAAPDAARIFVLENASAECGMPALRVQINSPLFARETFPAVVRRDQNLNVEVEKLLP